MILEKIDTMGKKYRDGEKNIDSGKNRQLKIIQKNIEQQKDNRKKRQWKKIVKKHIAENKIP